MDELSPNSPGADDAADAAYISTFLSDGPSAAWRLYPSYPKPFPERLRERLREAAALAALRPTSPAPSIAHITDALEIASKKGDAKTMIACVKTYHSLVAKQMAINNESQAINDFKVVNAHLTSEEIEERMVTALRLEALAIAERAVPFVDYSRHRALIALYARILGRSPGALEKRILHKYEKAQEQNPGVEPSKSVLPFQKRPSSL